MKVLLKNMGSGLDGIYEACYFINLKMEKEMLGRMPNNCNEPQQVCEPSRKEHQQLPIKEELKLAVDYLCEFHEKLSRLSYHARAIVEGWMRDGSYR